MFKTLMQCSHFAGGREFAATDSKTVGEMFFIIRQKIVELTKLSDHHKVNAKGQPINGIKL